MYFIDKYPTLAPPVIIFLLAFFFSVHATWIVRRLSIKLGVLDHPAARKKQAEPIPCLGGLAILFAVVCSLLFTYGRSPELQVILYVGVGIAIVGLLDDAFSVRATIKLLVLAVGCLILTLNGVGLNRTPFAFVNYALTFLWVAGVSSAFNAIDNSDGLAGTICVISSIVFFLLGWSTWQICFSFLSMALAGGTLGFLHHNVKPAKIYMGDSGSFFLGYVLSVLVIYGEWSDNGLRSFLAGCFVLAVPIYDLGLTTLLRVRHGIVKNVVEAIAYSDRDHLSHRLRKLGLSHRGMLSVFCLISAACCGTAIVIVHAPPSVALAAFCLACLALSSLGFYLDAKTSVPGLWVNGRQPIRTSKRARAVLASEKELA